MRGFVAVFILILLISSISQTGALPGLDARDNALSGYVHDPFGNGIKDAAVNALEYTSGTEYTATTDANGFFQFADIPNKMYFIRVSANGFYHQSKHDCIPGNAYEFVLQPSGGIVGRICSQNGEPVKNATLRLSNPKFGVEMYAESDESGSFRFTSSAFDMQIYPGHGYEIFASASGHISSLLAMNITVVRGEYSYQNLTLTKSASISGTVRGNNGEAVKDARVYAFHESGMLVCTAITDSDGTYCLNTDIGAGNYSLQVFPRTVAEGSWLNSKPINVSISSPGASVNNIDFVLMPAGIVKGNVSDEQGPLANAMLTVSNENGVCGFGVSDNNGTFSLSSPALSNGTYTLRAECTHHIWLERRIVVVEGTITWEDLNLSKSRSVSGYLKTNTGTSLLGSVEIFSTEGRSIEKIYTTQEGYFFLDTNLDAGSYRIEAVSPGYLQVSRTVDLSTTTSVENFNFTLSEAGKAIVNITDYAGEIVNSGMGYLIQKQGSEEVICETRMVNNGTLIFGDGWQNLGAGAYSLLIKNVPGCEEKLLEDFVYIENGKTNFYSIVLNKTAEFFGHVYYKKSTEPLEDVKIEFVLLDGLNSFATSAITWSDSGGYFHIMGSLPGGTYSILAQHYLYGSAVQNTAIQTGEKLEVNIYFIPSSGTGGVHGVVMEKGGDVLSGVSVAIYNGTKKVKSCITNETGGFFLADIPEGIYKIVFEKVGYTRLEITNFTIVSDETTDIGVVELEKSAPLPGNITGYVIDESGKPIAGASIVVEGSEISVISDSMGEFHITGLKEGVYFLLVSAPGYKDVRKDVSITPGNNTTVWIEMEKEIEVKTTPGFTFLDIFLLLPVLFLLWKKRLILR